MRRKRNAPGLGGAGAARLRLGGAYRVFRFPQLRTRIRRCVCCGVRVTNRNLGGHPPQVSVERLPLVLFLCRRSAANLSSDREPQQLLLTLERRLIWQSSK